LETKDKAEKNKGRSMEAEIFRFIAQDIRVVIRGINPDDLESLEEIRLRANKPLMLQNKHGDWFVDSNGRLTKSLGNLRHISQEDIIKTVELISENSIYAFQEDIRGGFITLKGGHRVGIAGRVVLEDGRIKNIKDISALNIRVSREITGCSDRILKHIVKSGNKVFNTLIISPPQCGKTTMLRDIARALSDGIPRLKFKGVKLELLMRDLK
jgi:stage III sporulation protein AA